MVLVVVRDGVSILVFGFLWCIVILKLLFVGNVVSDVE